MFDGTSFSSLVIPGYTGLQGRGISPDGRYISLLDSSGGRLSASGINSAGDLVGFANSVGNQSLFWTASPVPEPATWALWAVGLLAPGSLARRRSLST